MTPYYEHAGITIYHGDSLSVLRDMSDCSVNCCVTSPPYWGLRDYGVEGQLGLEKTPDEFVAKMVAVFREVRRVLKSDGTLWLNIGDSYASGKGTCYNPGGGEDSLGKERKAEGAHPLDRGNKSALAAVGLKPKDLVGIPWMLAFALRADGWWLRQDIIWSKPNPMPESVTDRCTKAHEYLFMLSKSARYFYNAEAIKEVAIYQPGDGGGNQTFGAAGGKAEAVYGAKVSGEVWERNGKRNKRSVWEIATQPFAEAHFATFPQDLIKPCILAGCKAGGVVLDPFGGSMTTMKVSRDLNCRGISVELNADYIEIGLRRLKQEVFNFDSQGSSETLPGEAVG